MGGFDRGWSARHDLLVDPITLVVTAVALGAAAGVTETASQVVRDAYAGLKALLTGRAVDVSAVERRPDSHAQQAALTETLTDPGGVDEEVVAAARAVTEAVAAHDSAVAPGIGVDLERVRAGGRGPTRRGDGVEQPRARTAAGAAVRRRHHRSPAEHRHLRRAP